jgi:hypothetical protein
MLACTFPQANLGKMDSYLSPLSGLNSKSLKRWPLRAPYITLHMFTVHARRRRFSVFQIIHNHRRLCKAMSLIFLINFICSSSNEKKQQAQTENIEWLIDAHGRMTWLLPHPLPPASVCSTAATHRNTDGGGGGRGAKYTDARKPGPL